MNDAAGAMTPVLAHDHVVEDGAIKRSFVVIAGGGALLGAVAGVAIAVPLAAASGVAVFIATAIDIAAGLALIGGLIGANIAGTD